MTSLLTQSLGFEVGNISEHIIFSKYIIFSQHDTCLVETSVQTTA